MNTHFKQLLKELRQEKGLSQKELAESLKYTQSNISEWEKGSVEPRLTALITISEYFDVSVDYLIGREDDFGIKKSDGAVTPSAYSKEEQKIIEDYRRLNYMSKKLVLQTLATLQPSASETKQKINKKG